MKELRRIWAIPAAAFILFGCSDESGPSGPSEPEPVVPEEIQLNLSCDVQLSGGGSIVCEPADPHVGGGAAASIFADPNALVHLETARLNYAAGVFSADVSIRSNLMQPLGTADGAKADADGVRVFFVSDPVTTGGSGTVTVRNPDGTDDFNGTDQPYFQYAQAIAPGTTSFPKSWEWDVPATVESFTFEVGVHAKVVDASDLTPGLNFNVSTLYADSLHTCALDISGQPYCWGSGGSGRLGNRGLLAQTRPVAVVTGGEKFVTIETGLSHTCGLTVKGEAWCWGNGTYGRLGTGATSSVNTPARVSGGRTYVQIAAGRTHTCALDTEGAVYCWGSGSYGKLGTGSTNDSHLPAETIGGRRYTWLSSGSYHTCAIATTGEAYCWGSATNGKRGDGVTSGSIAEPVLVAGDHSFAKIYAGEQHSCALTADGEAWCWGSNAHGQLGDGTQESSPVPVPVTGGHHFIKLALGFDYTCGVATTGKAYCWGSNTFGKLGHGSDLDEAVPTPTEVVEVDNFTSIAAGTDHTCGSTLSGDVYCWGTADTGRLGTGSTTDVFSTPTQVTTLSGIAFLGASPASCDAGAGTSLDCFPRRSLQERIELALGVNGQRASSLI